MNISPYFRNFVLCLLLLTALASPCAADETVVEVRFRGNFTIPDEELVRLGGIEVGTPAAAVSPEELKQRLLRTGRFELVEVAKRYRSLSDTGEVVLVVTVKEKQPVKSKFMFMPILTGSDEYGFTYGGRATAIDLLGAGERLSIPLTWGGVRRAALESEFEFQKSWATALEASVGISRKENPYYKIGDFRREVQGILRRRFNRFELNVRSGWSGVDFGPESMDIWTFGTGLVVDTRQDVNLPRDAVYAGVAWDRLSLPGGGPGFNLYTVDLRGYKGLFGQAIVAGQFLYRGADGRLPDFERPFLGGAGTLRGYEPGSFIGDNLAITSVELRMPLTSPRAAYHAGIDLFLDSGAVYDNGSSLGNADFRHGAGFGGFFLIAGFGIKVDLAYNMHDAFRVHFSTGFRF